MPQGKDAESWVLSFACFLVSQCICQKTECAKRSAKSTLWWSPVLFFFWGGSQWTKHSHNHSDPAGGFLSHGGSQNHPSHYLVGGIPTPLKNMSSSVGMMKFPNIWKKNPFMFQTTNQLQLTSDRFVDRKNITAITGVQAERQRLRRLQTQKWRSLLNCLVSIFHYNVKHL